MTRDLLPSAMRKTVIEIAESVAQSIQNPDDLDIPEVERCGFATGHAGTALFLLALSQIRDRWLPAAHAHLASAARSGCSSRGLFSGLAGLLFVSTYAARSESRYSRLRDQCAQVLITAHVTNPRLLVAKHMAEYDLTSGSAGIYAAASYAGARLRGIESYLKWLFEDSARWACVHPAQNSDESRNDVGMAHGAAGVLAALCSSASTDVEATAAIDSIVAWLTGHRLRSPSIQWTWSIGTEEPQPTRAAWCYGTPGVAIALLQGAKRLKSDATRQLAVDALIDLANLPWPTWKVIDSCLCHGVAGNALIFAAAASDERSGHLREMVGELAVRAIDDFDGSLRYGFRVRNVSNSAWVECPSLLNGAAGIALALITLAFDVESSWLRAFGLPAI